MENVLAMQEEALEQYLSLFETIKARVGDSDSTLGLLQVICKDARSHKLNGNQADNGDGASATPKQIGLLKRLGVDIPNGLSKIEASRMIDSVKHN